MVGRESQCQTPNWNLTKIGYDGSGRVLRRIGEGGRRSSRGGIVSRKIQLECFSYILKVFPNLIYYFKFNESD